MTVPFFDSVAVVLWILCAVNSSVTAFVTLDSQLELSRSLRRRRASLLSPRIPFLRLASLFSGFSTPSSASSLFSGLLQFSHCLLAASLVCLFPQFSRLNHLCP